MNVYHIWCNLKEGVRDTEFSDRAEAYFGHLKDQGVVSQGWWKFGELA